MMAKVRLVHAVYFDAETQSTELLPLLECLSYAIERNRSVDSFLKGILPLGKGGYCSGDPGWKISGRDDDLENWYDSEGHRLYYAWTHEPISGLNPFDGYYPVDVVRHHVREVLNKFRHLPPEHAAEVDAALASFSFKKFSLNIAKGIFIVGKGQLTCFSCIKPNSNLTTEYPH